MEYELWVEEALLSVVRRALLSVQTQGLQGNHHVYIAFQTHYPGVEIPDFLRTSYPDEMTILLQDNFWNLEVSEHFFKVGLHFRSLSHELTIPFRAIKSFMDPSVEWGLKFSLPFVPVSLDAVQDESQEALSEKKPKILHLKKKDLVDHKPLT